MPFHSQRFLMLLFLLVPYILTDNLSPQIQEVAVGALNSDDAPEFLRDHVSASGWTTAESSDPELGLPQPITPVIESSELPLGVDESVDCSGAIPDQVQPASKPKRSRIVDKRETTFCINSQFQKPKPASEPVPGSGRSQTKGPASGDEAGRQPRLPEPDAGIIENLVSRVRGTLGKPNAALCLSNNPYYRIPICVSVSPVRFSPAATVEPARLCKYFPKKLKHPFCISTQD